VTIVRSIRTEALPQHVPHRRRRALMAVGDRPSAYSRPSDRFAAAPVPAARPTGLPRNLTALEVVVVDDDEDSLAYFAAALRACGATVLTASAAVDALALVREREPHVVLSDIAMVGYDGYWLVAEIRKLADRAVRPIPVVATTAFGREHSRTRALAAGFSELLPKPVDPEVLCLAMAKAVGR
jgi:CheY-like chemotaxis protein